MRSRWATGLLLIALLVQCGIGAAEDRWEPDIRRFEAAPVVAGGVVFYGSSTFRLWTTLAEDFPGLPVINRGFGGSGVADAVRYLDRVVVPLSPRSVVLYAGGNNIGTLTPPAIAAEMSTLVVALRTALPTTRIVLLSLKPTRARAGQAEIVREVNRRYAELAVAHAEVVYVDLWTRFLDETGQPDARWLADDGHHPSRAGYQRIAELTRPHLP